MNSQAEVSKPPMKKIQATMSADEWEQDSKGYFLIDPRNDEQLIYAHFYSNLKEYIVSIFGKNAQEIYYTIIREKLISSQFHAAYLGTELYKAEMCMKENKKYTQDESCFDN